MARPVFGGDVAIVARARIDIAWRWVVKRDWPGLRRSSQCWISPSARAMRGGTPSTTQPIAGPWLSPQLVKLNSRPKLLAAIENLHGGA
jgi:hypothetical protein